MRGLEIESLGGPTSEKGHYIRDLKTQYWRNKFLDSSTTRQSATSIDRRIIGRKMTEPQWGCLKPIVGCNCHKLSKVKWHDIIKEPKALQKLCGNFKEKASRNPRDVRWVDASNYQHVFFSNYKTINKTKQTLIVWKPKG